MKIVYSSNNSGGSWWLSDEDWKNLEARIDASNDIEAFVIAQSTHCDALDWCKHSPTFKLALKRISNFPVDNKLNI